MLYSTLDTLKESDPEVQNVKAELELRIMLNIVFKMVIHNHDDAIFIEEFCLPQHIRMEEICLRAVKFSLEI